MKVAIWALALTGMSCAAEDRISHRAHAPEAPAAELMMTGGGDVHCSGMRPLAGHNVTDVLQRCIDATPTGGTLYLPPGSYYIATQIKVLRSMTIQTEGLTPADVQCSFWGDARCAELIAFDAFLSAPPSPVPGVYSGTMVFVHANGVKLDHLSINGGSRWRHIWMKSAQGNPAVACLTMYGSDSSVRNSVIKGAIGNAGFQLIAEPNMASDRFVMDRSTVAWNGWRDLGGSGGNAFADGAQIYETTGSSFTNLTFYDNTDVDFIFGACRSCTVNNIQILHSTNPDYASHAGLMVQRWGPRFIPATSGRYDGTVFNGVSVDCGPSRLCGAGIEIGGGRWYADDYWGVTEGGGTLANSYVSNARIGLVVQNSGPFSITNFGVWGAGGARDRFAPSGVFWPYGAAPDCSALSATTLPAINIDPNTWGLNFPQYQTYANANAYYGNTILGRLNMRGCVNLP